MKNGSLGKVVGIQGNKLLVIPDEKVSVYELSKFADGEPPTIEFNILDGRPLSSDQRKKIRAIIGDIAEYTGYRYEKKSIDNDEAAKEMKELYMTFTGQEMFSLSNCSMTVAREYLEWLLDFCFDNDIGFNMKTWDMLPKDPALIFRCTKKRLCIFCGNHAEIDHTFGLVGIGRNRKSVNNENSYFLPLCHKHHKERHQLGTMTFLNKHHIQPIKLNRQIRKQLHIGNN